MLTSWRYFIRNNYSNSKERENNIIYLLQLVIRYIDNVDSADGCNFTEFQSTTNLHYSVRLHFFLTTYTKVTIWLPTIDLQKSHACHLATLTCKYYTNCTYLLLISYRYKYITKSWSCTECDNMRNFRGY